MDDAGPLRAIEPGPDLPPTSIRTTGFALAGLFLVGAVVPPHPDLDPTFGLEAYRGRLLLYVAATVLLLLLLNVPGAARRTAHALGRAASFVPYPTAVVGLGALVAFLAVRNVRLSGDGTTFVSMAATGAVVPSNALTCYLHKILNAIPGVTPLDAVRLTSALAGGVYAFAVLGIARTCFEDATRRACLATLLLTAGSVVLFFGSIEVYAPLVAGIAVYLLVGLRHLRGLGRGFAPPLVLGVTFALHGSAGLLLPSLLLLANDGRLRPVRVKRLLLWGSLFAIPVLLVFAVLWFGTWGGSPPTLGHERLGSFGGTLGQGPILPLVRSDTNLTHRYAMFDVEHLLGVLNLWFLAAPVGLALLVLGRRRLLRPPFGPWLASAAAFLMAFPVFWNVAYSLRRDWDLFSPAGVPLTLVAAVAVLGRHRGSRSSERWPSTRSRPPSSPARGRASSAWSMPRPSPAPTAAPRRRPRETPGGRCSGRPRSGSAISTSGTGPRRGCARPRPTSRPSVGRRRRRSTGRCSRPNRTAVKRSSSSARCSP